MRISEVCLQVFSYGSIEFDNSPTNTCNDTAELQGY